MTMPKRSARAHVAVAVAAAARGGVSSDDDLDALDLVKRRRGTGGASASAVAKAPSSSAAASAAAQRKREADSALLDELLGVGGGGDTCASQSRGGGVGPRGGGGGGGLEGGRFLSGVDLDAPPSDSDAEEEEEEGGEGRVKGSPPLVRPPAGRAVDPALFADDPWDGRGRDGAEEGSPHEMETSEDEGGEKRGAKGGGEGMGGILKSASVLAERLVKDGPQGVDGDTPPVAEWERVLDARRATVMPRGYFVAVPGSDFEGTQDAWGTSEVLGEALAHSAEEAREALGSGSLALWCAGPRSRPAFLTAWLWRVAVAPCAVEDEAAAQGGARALEAMAARVAASSSAATTAEVWSSEFTPDVCSVLEAMGYCEASESVAFMDGQGVESGAMPEGEAAVGMSVLKEWKGHEGAFKGTLTGYEAVTYPDQPGVVAMEYTCEYEDGDAEDLSPRAARKGVDAFRVASARARGAREAEASAGAWTRPLGRLLAVLPPLAAAGLLPQSEVEACLPRLVRVAMDPVVGRLAGALRDISRAVSALVACLSDQAWGVACPRLAASLARGTSVEPSRAFRALNAMPTRTLRERALQRLAAMRLLDALNDSSAYLHGGGQHERHVALGQKLPPAQGAHTKELPSVPEVTGQVRRMTEHVLGKERSSGVGSAASGVNFWSLRTCVLLADMALGEPYALVDGERSAPGGSGVESGRGGEPGAAALEDMAELCVAAKRLGKCIRRGMRKSANMAKVAVDLLVAGKYEYAKDAMAHGFHTSTPRKELDPFAELSEEEEEEEKDEGRGRASDRGDVDLPEEVPI